MANRYYLFCKDCKDVRQVSPDPECIHFGRITKQKNTESVMVIFRTPDGRISVPWSPDVKCPKGAVREEVRGARAVRRLEREMDAKDLSKHRSYVEKTERMMEPVNRSMREGLKNQMRNARNQFEHDYAQAALNRLERTPISSGYDPGNHRSE